MEKFLSDHSAEILVWDNGSQNGKPETLASPCPLIWHDSSKNIGFARGHLSLAQKASGKRFLIVNPDTWFAPGSLELLWRAMGDDTRIGMVVPRVIYPDGRLQPSVFPPYSFCFDLRKSFWLEGQTFLWPSQRRLWKKLARAEESFPIGWASGACFLITREVWEKTGGFDPSFFFGGEDADFCRRVWTVGSEIWCEPRAVVLHQAGQSMQKEPGNRILYYYQKRLYFAYKNFSRFRSFLLTAISSFELAYKWLVGVLLAVFKPRWKEKKRGYAAALCLIFSSRYRHPGEWVEDWIKDGPPGTRVKV